MAQDNTIPHGKPGIASFESETWGNKGEIRFGDTPVKTMARTVVAGADLDLKLYSVVSVIAGVLALAVNGTTAGAASGTATFSTAAVSANDTVTINGRVYTFKAAVTTTADEVLVGADELECAANLAAAVNATEADAGTLFGSDTTINEDVRATVSAGVVTLIALNPGDEGNAITLAKSGANIAVSGGTLTGGDDDLDTKPYGILAEPVVMTNGQSMSVEFIRTGHFNMDALTWDASFATEESKRSAFEGSLSPGIFISKPEFNDDGVPV